MESLSRDKVLRWFSGQQSQGGSVGDGGSVDLAGYATQIWTEQNYVGKEFFSSLFKAYDANGNEVLPNDTETVIDNIKAMFGFWTDFYISALGTGGQSTVGLRLAQLSDVNVAGVTNGQVLTYDSTSGKWIASTPQSGTDMATVWANLAASGNQQINYSHLSGAVSLSNGTITIGSSSITPITSHQSLAGYAKETWVGLNYLKLTGGTINGNLNVTGTLSVASKLVATQEWVGQNYISIAFFDRLFKAYNGNTQVNANDTTSTIDNIKAMFGFWTDFYISALGTGGQSTVGLRLAQLADVNVAGVTNGQVLTYDTTSGKWIASTPQSGTDMATVWSNLAASGNQQINASHLKTALTGYATQTWVGQQGYITSSAIRDMATKTWVGTNYLKLTGGTIISNLNVTGKLSVASKLVATQEWVGQNYISWTNLAASGNQQINYSHLSGAVSLSNGTITIGSSSITPITSHQSLAGYAKEQWVSQNYLPLAGGTITGSLTVNNTLSTGGNTTVGGDLTVNGGDLTVNEPNASGASAIWFQSGGTTYGNLRVKASNGEFYFYNGTTGDGQSSVCVNAGWFYAYGQVTALSDERKKNVVGDIKLTVEQIAQARAVEFYWKDKRDKNLHIGSIAQDWQKILPQAVFEKDGELSMDYSVIALMCGITIARKVEDHESRLRRLEKMFAITNDNDSEN